MSYSIFLYSSLERGHSSPCLLSPSLSESSPFKKTNAISSFLYFIYNQQGTYNLLSLLGHLFSLPSDLPIVLQHPRLALAYYSPTNVVYKSTISWLQCIRRTSMEKTPFLFHKKHYLERH